MFLLDTGIVLGFQKSGHLDVMTEASSRIPLALVEADLGEAASIALAAHDPSMTFVTNDGAASLRGLQELRGRTMSFHPLLAILVEKGGIAPAKASALAKAVQDLRDWRATHPHWWDAWCAGQTGTSP